ncbi:hypothetical protein ABFY60_27675 [Lysinibacillus pakistanensis]|jgi:hypothetical protein|uniref:hypothetical protein n=1 Tax=Lysinibacillus pakistanensis TaxID=759811 RepID=UPI003D29CBB7
MFFDSDMFNDKVTLMKLDGTIVENIAASVQRDKIFIDDGTLLIEEGDILERKMSNGLTEKYEVTDRGYYEAFGAFDAHYQCDVRKLTSVKETVPSSRTINNYFNAPNTRYNENSTDNSINMVVNDDTSLFDEIRATLKQQNIEENELAILIEQINDMQQSIGQDNFSDKYARFIQGLGNHVTVVAPFLPALSQYLIA